MEKENNQAEDKKEQEGGLPRFLYDTLEVFALCLVPIILLLTLVGRFIYVDGPSMIPTLHHNDVMAVQVLGYTPRQGDVVILTQEFANITGPIVKRVIATEGQTVDIDYEGHTVSVDGVVQEEPYINFEPMYEPNWPNATHITVPEGSIFVMGDNRNHSNDSRDLRLGTVDTRRVLGRAVAVLFPLNDFGVIE